MQRKTKNFFLKISLIILFIITGFVYIKKNFFASYETYIDKIPELYLNIAIIINILFLVLFSENKQIGSIDEKRKKEQEQEIIRKELFKTKYGRISSTRLGKYIILPRVKEGKFGIILLGIIALFCIIKIPYLSTPLTNDYPDKYPSYIQAAQTMIKEGPFVYKRDYLKILKGNPFKEDGYYRKFSSYPILERTFAASKTVFPNSSREILSRVIMTILGTLLLITLYIFLKHFLEKSQILFFLTLLAINPLFQFFTFLTVLDPINLIILFLALHFLIKGIEKDNIQLIYITGLLAGIGICIKYHAIIFYLPLFCLFLYRYQKNSPTKTLGYLSITLPNFILQTIFFRLSVRYIPSNPPIFLTITGIMILTQIYIYTKITKIHKRTTKNIQKIGHTKIYGILIIAAIVSLIGIFTIPEFAKMGQNFLTDQYLITNGNIYRGITTLNIFLTSGRIYGLYIACFFLIQLLPLPKKYKLLSVSFVITGIIYTIIASKILYSHFYYHHIQIICILFHASFFRYITSCYEKPLGKYITRGLFIGLLGIQNFLRIQKTIGTYNPDIIPISNYIKQHLQTNQNFLYNGAFASSISLYSERKFYILNTTTLQQLSNELQKNESIEKIISKYTIKYFITCPINNFNPNRWYELYNNIIPNYKIPEETRRLLCATKNTYCDTVPEDKQPNENIRFFFNKNILPHIVLTQQIGECGIYTLQ